MAAILESSALVLSTAVCQPWREWIFEKFAALGWVLPLILMLNYIMISMILFGSISFLAFCSGESECTLGGVQHTVVTLHRFIDFYTWHVLDTIPLLEIPDTLPWKTVPLDHSMTPSLLGAVVIAFKMAVIVPGIGAFNTYWEQRTAASETA